jgi:WD40 repeat protein
MKLLPPKSCYLKLLPQEAGICCASLHPLVFLSPDEEAPQEASVLSVCLISLHVVLESSQQLSIFLTTGSPHVYCMLCTAHCLILAPDDATCAQSSQQLSLIPDHGESPVRDVAFSPNSRYLATCSEDQTMRVFEARRTVILFDG